MDVPSPEAGTVKEVLVSVNDKVSEGTPIVVLDGGVGDGSSGGEKDEAPKEKESEGSESGSQEDVPSGEESAGDERPDAGPSGAESRKTGQGVRSDDSRRDGGDSGVGGGTVYAGPGVRRLARELGVDLANVKGSGRKGRILKEDVKAAKDAPAKAAPDAPAGIPGLDLAPWPKVNFEKYGEVERVALSRVKKISGPVLARNWVMIPHVTHNDEADITDLEAFRKQVNSEQTDVKVTMVALLMKACVGALRQCPEFNSSLDGDELVIKRYFNIGFAADTPQGLLVPVIKEADRKGLLDIAGELTELSGKAREGTISAEEMRGSTFTISSLGGIGGTSFTPIINAPEVAILGVTRSRMTPVWDKEAEEFKPRLMVPLSLSYDHRVIDGAAAARFTAHLAGELRDIRRALL
jgi:pyruvate dehydrogenase E2 component (dihydrolipoamide acetyltransferase)